MEAGRIDKGLQHQQGVTEMLLPIALNSPAQPRKNLGAQILVVTSWQNQKPGIVGHQIQPIILMAIIPADPLISKRPF
jgi:hypothetical protein